MARNRQRAKQRQAERRAQRLAEKGEGDGQRSDAQAPPREPEPTPPEPDSITSDDPVPGVVPGIDPGVMAGAPPQDEGMSETLVPDEVEELDDDDDPELAYDAEEAGALEGVELDEAYAPRGRRGADAEGGEAKDRPRFVQFLIAVWAELQRVQWPDRQALTTLTGVVLGFVLIMGGYLGLLDAIFSRLIQAIL